MERSERPAARARPQESAKTRFFRPGGSGVPRWLHLLALIAAIAAGVLAFPLLSHAVPAVGTTAPDFALKDLGGANQRLSEFQGDIVVLTFWASGCGPCRETLAELRAVGNERVADAPVVLSVSLERDSARAASVARSLGIAYPTLLDDRQSVARLYDVSHLPLTLLLDRDGVVRRAWARDRIPTDELLASIRELQRQ